ncbi:hypothetical protein V7S43_010606 [Phytophthora oleae]|uniref:Guanylate cyclase domain-containing protein n=1 Tax=Phytophthora oleae TaxID=2107226 RepID=A0ABD3FH11_9STRA
MILALVCVGALALSTLGTGLIVLKLYTDWNVRASSVRWLLAVFLRYQFTTSAARLAYFIWLIVAATTLDHYNQEDLQGQAVVGTELYRLGTRAVLELGQKQNSWVTAVIILGDTTHFGLTIWVGALVYEVSKLVELSMDRGEKQERVKIMLYSRVGHACIATFLVIQVVLAIMFTGYSRYAYSLLLAVYAVQIMVLMYMMVMVILLKVKGRNMESVHGHFVASPLYRRLKWITYLAYALFAFQFQFSSLILYAVPQEANQFSGYAGVSFTLYYLRGFVLSVVAGCSQPCVVRCLGCCVPEEVKALYTQRRDCVAIPGGSDLPYINPVFVFTDIESSSALWAVEDGRVMQQATVIHDDILRGLLAAYRGYEITTAGDSFQLAFHTIQEAVEYCLGVQMQLLKA